MLLMPMALKVLLPIVTNHTFGIVLEKNKYNMQISLNDFSNYCCKSINSTSTLSTPITLLLKIKNVEQYKNDDRKERKQNIL